MLHFIGKTLWLAWNWLELAVFTVMLYLLAWLPQTLMHSFYRKLFRIWCRSFIRALGVKLRLHQKNIRPLPQQYILIGNHPSALEDVGMPALFDVYPLAKFAVKSWFMVGRISRAAGSLFVKRDDSDSRHAAGGSLIELLEEGKNILLFPEGGCMGRRIHSTFQYGAFDISLKTGIPIVPVFIHYEAQETFEWKKPYTLIEMIWRFMTSQNDRANYYVFDAIDPENFKDKKAFTEYVHELYLKWQKRYLE